MTIYREKIYFKTPTSEFRYDSYLNLDVNVLKHAFFSWIITNYQWNYNSSHYYSIVTTLREKDIQNVLVRCCWLQKLLDKGSLSFFSLPKDKKIANAWKARIGRTNLPSNIFFCERHFENSSFDASVDIRNRLMRGQPRSQRILLFWFASNHANRKGKRR